MFLRYRFVYLKTKLVKLVAAQELYWFTRNFLGGNMYRKLVMVLVGLLSMSANAGDIIFRISNKIFTAKFKGEVEVGVLSENQVIDLLKTSEVHEVLYSSNKGGLLKKKYLPVGTWTEADNAKIMRPGTWTESDGKIKMIDLKNVKQFRDK